MREAMFYESLEEDRVRCTLCGLLCRIRPGSRGACGVRVNRGGRLYTLVDDRVAALHVDPIEKKPLFHYLPGHASFSIGTVGCNFRCLHCQNSSLSQQPRLEGGRRSKEAEPHVPGERVTPDSLVRAAVEGGCRSIAYTYSEPTVFFELALETARLARQEGLGNVFVTNGFITEAPLVLIAPVLDAANIDLKFIDKARHRRVTGAPLQPVLDSIKRYRDLDIWIEVTTLVIPGLNDSEESLRSMAEFIHGVDPDIPWHVTRFHPQHRLLDRGPTPVSTLSRARTLAAEAGLRFCYSGNVPGDEGEATSCPGCGAVVLRRYGSRLVEDRIKGGGCPECGTRIPGVFDGAE